jgi:hypothetical protein
LKLAPLAVITTAGDHDIGGILTRIWNGRLKTP